MLISVAIPCYNSSKTLPTVVKEIQEVFSNQKDYEYEIVLVNDNSPDNTFEVIQQLCRENSNIVGVDLSKNYGQSSALMAAINYVKGDIAVFMDDDGQHPPDELFKLVEQVENGNDLVYACFPQKKHSAFKRITSNLNSKLLEATNRKPKGIKITSYFALSKLSVNALREYKSPYPSICGYLLQVTRRIVNVEINHRARLAGSSNYNLKKLITLWLQGFTNFSIAPLRFASMLGAVFAVLGFCVMLYYIICKLVNPNVAVGFTSIVSLILIIGGFIMLMLGIIGEYIGRIYILLSDMPQFRVREVINKEDNVNED
ncbi:MAG: glycosyltransferase family 2 protein [Acutalibacteraceae bacterium]|nr:glycosyltransferase family 2 protein [Acutalibacteraceae bacterium]